MSLQNKGRKNGSVFEKERLDEMIYFVVDGKGRLNMAFNPSIKNIGESLIFTRSTDLDEA